jgi:glucuronosyltransferase
MRAFSICVALAALIVCIDGFKVLGIFPIGATSHFTIGHAIVKSLLDAGNEVTVISHYPQKKPLKNYRDISMADALEKYEKGEN